MSERSTPQVAAQPALATCVSDNSCGRWAGSVENAALCQHSMELDQRDEQLVVVGDAAASAQVPAKNPDNRTKKQLEDLILNAPTLNQRTESVYEDMKKELETDQHATNATDTTDTTDATDRTLKIKRLIGIKRMLNMPLLKHEWAFLQSEGERESMSKVYDPDITSSDFERKLHGLASDDPYSETHYQASDVLRTPAVISCGCANLGILPCQFRAGGAGPTPCTAAEPGKGHSVQCLADIHTCMTKQIGLEEADKQLAALCRGLSTQAGMELRVRVATVCDGIDCKLASGVEDIKRRATNNLKDEQAANQSNGNTRYGSAELLKENLVLIRRLFVEEKVDAATARSMVLDTANWTYWVSYRQRTFISTAKAFADNQSALHTKFNRDALQTMLDDFAHIPTTYFNTIMADHIVSPDSDGFSERFNRSWESYFLDLFKIRAPDPLTSLFTWLRVMLWKQMGCRVCPTSGKLLDVVDANNPAIELYKNGMAFHHALKSTLDGFSSNKTKLQQRCTEANQVQGTRSAHISIQMAAAQKSCKDAATQIAAERGMFGSMMNTIFRPENAAPDMETIVHKNLDYYAPACCGIFLANNVHAADRVTNAALCLNIDLLFPEHPNFSRTKLLTLFLEGGTGPDNAGAGAIKDRHGQKGWRVTASQVVHGEIETPQPHRARFTTDLPAYIASSAMQPEAVYGAPRPATSAGALFDASFVPKVGVVSGLGLLVHKPGPEHLSTKDQVHNLAVQLQSAERIVASAASIHAALRFGESAGVVHKQPVEQGTFHAEWLSSPAVLTDKDLVAEGGAELLTQLLMATKGMVLCHEFYGRTQRPDTGCPDRSAPAYPEALVDDLRAFVSAVEAWRAPLPQAVLNKAFRREPAQGLKHAPIKQAKLHAVTNYNSVVNQGLLDPSKYSLDAYTELDYNHFLLTNEISRNRYKRTWRDLLLSRMSTRSEAEQQRLAAAFADATGPIDHIYDFPEDPLEDAKEFPTHHAWEAKCNQLLDAGHLDEDLPSEPLSFAYWLHRQGIDPVERFSTHDDMRMLHVMQHYRVRIQALRVQSAKAKEHMPIKHKRGSDLRTRYVANYQKAIQAQYDAGCKQLDLVHKRTLGRWLYMDQLDSDGTHKYLIDDATRAIEADFVLEMAGRFTGGYAHAIERQRNIKSGRLRSVYDGATRNAGEMELEREAAAASGLAPFLKEVGIDLAAIDAEDDDQRGPMGVADVVSQLAESGGTFVGGAIVAVADDGDVETEAPAPAGDSAPKEPDEMDTEEAGQMMEDARKDQLANGTLTIFSPDLDYHAVVDWKSSLYKNTRQALFERVNKRAAAPSAAKKPKPAKRTKYTIDPSFNPMDF